MKMKDVPVLEQKVLGMLPITQAEIWKTLGIGHRDVSELVGIMLHENLIKKKRFQHTFLLEKKNKKGTLNYASLLSHGKFSPCCGCRIDCIPSECHLLTDWLKSE